MMIVWFFVEVYGCHRDLHVLTHSFPTRRSSDLGFAPAEVVAVLGASGSGKSTLLRSIAGLQSLSAGGVELDALDVTDVEPHKRGVGLMFQDHALFPHRDVRSEEHTSELQSLMRISYAVFCLKKKNT